jgi:transcriptional regulator with XRE-family HTH domain
MPVSGSLVVRRQLGRRLRALREEAGKTREDVAITRICSRPKLEKIEHGQVSVRPGDVRELCRFFGRADPETVEVLVSMAYATSEPGWWEQYGDVLRPDFALYLGLEATAGALYAYESEVVHGLLQTPAYARGIELATRIDVTPEQVHRFVALRGERQREVFGSRRPPRVEIVLGEAALLKPVRPPEAMRDQLLHLRRMAATRERLEIRVLPHSAGQTPAVFGSFSVLDFDDPADPAVGYHETYDGAHYPEDPERVARFRRRFTVIRELSVPIQEYAS